MKDNSDPNQPSAEFNPQTKNFWTLGSVTTDKGLIAKSVEVVNGGTDETTGFLQAPTIRYH